MTSLQDAWDDAPSVPSTLFEARALMQEIARLQDEQDEQNQLEGEIVHAYTEATHARQQRISALKQALLQYIQHTGKPAKVPDVGTAYTTTRKAKVRVTDPDAAVPVARELDPEGRDGLWKPTVSRTKLGERAQEHLERTGVILPGCELVPETTTLSIRFAKGTEQ